MHTDGHLANLELPTVEQLAKAIAATISQRINTPPELQHGSTISAPSSLGKEDEESAENLRLAVALTSSVALLRAVRLRTIVIYLTESGFDPSELLVHPFTQTVKEAGERGGNTGHN
eukprot:jgi/Tetstr1/422962/TSEL_013740.t1